MNLTMRGSLRPRHDQVLAYAESLVDGKPMPVKVAGAIANDQHATEELRAIRSSLEVVAKAPELEPSDALTRAILLEARRMRQPEQQRTLRYISAWRGFFYGTLFSAVVVSASLVVFGMALRSPAAMGVSQPAATLAALPAPQESLSADALTRKADEVEALSAAVRTAPRDPGSPERMQRLRAVTAVDSDLAAALKALERNPGSARATHVVYTSLQRQADSLREYYVDRNL